MPRIATFTNRAPVTLFEVARASVGTTFTTLYTPTLYAEVDALGRVEQLRTSTAVLTALSLANTSSDPRKVTFNVRSAGRVTYAADVVAQPGQNWVRIDRTIRPSGPSSFGYDWTDTPPVRLAQAPAGLGAFGRDVAWHPAGRYVAAVSSTNGGFVYDSEDGFSVVATLSPPLSPAQVVGCVWSPDGRYLAIAVSRQNLEVAGNEPAVRVFDFDAGIGSPVEVALPGVMSLVTSAFLRGLAWGGPDGRYLVVSGAGTTGFVVWDWGAGSPVHSASLSDALSQAIVGAGRAIAFSPDPSNPMLAALHTSGDRLTVFEWPTATTVAKVENAIFSVNTPQTPESFRGLAWSSDGRYLTCLTGPGAVPFTVYDFEGGISLRPEPAPLPSLPPLFAAAWSADGRYLVIGHAGAERFALYPVALPYLLLYDYDSGAPVRVTQNPALQGFGGVYGIDFSPDNSTLLIVGINRDANYPPTGLDNFRLLDSENVNLMVNGSFENTTGMEPADFGFTAPGEILGWFTDQEPRDTVTLFFPNRRFADAFATQGSVYLYPIARGLPGVTADDPKLRQNFDTLTEGQTYRLLFDVTASLNAMTGVRVFWNGTPVEVEGSTNFPVAKDSLLLSVTVPPESSLVVPLGRHMLSYGDNLQVKADGGGVSCSVSFVLSTQDSVPTLDNPETPVPEEVGDI